MKYTLEDKMTSLRAVSLAVLLYILGYALKISVLLIDILTPVISNMLIRGVAAGFTGVALSTGLLIVSVNDHSKYTPYIIAVMDAFMLLLVFDILNSSSLNDTVTLSFISFFMAFIGYQLISVFVAKYQRIKTEKEQGLSELLQAYSEKEQVFSELQQQINELKQNTCEYCEREFTSKNALNAHKGRCSNNPKNI
nr:hypothetical protein BACY1_20700 [Tenacibaculum mesophilum]